uniref:IlvB-like protein n=1 Tax=Ditylenchus dipsaci TaxID=166011 RepID=A0A915DNG1_9BILA
MQFLKRVLGNTHSKNKYLISSLFNVEETSKRLVSHGVKEVFTLCGGHISPILVSCENLGIRVVDTRHEVTTVYAADAVARLKQTIGVAAVTSGPGITNTITAVKNAQMAESPILLIANDPESYPSGSICTPGPVFIEFPLDVLHHYEMAGRDCYVPNATELKFNGGHYFSSQRPILLMGAQATLPPVSAKQLQATVEAIGVPTYLGGMCRGLLGINSQIQLRHNRRDALKATDVVILAGTVADFRLDYGKILSPNSKVIAINRDSIQLKKNLVKVSKKLTEKEWKSPPEWLNKLKEKEIAKERKNQKKMKEASPDGKLNPLKLLGQLDKVIPEDAILVADGGDFVGSAAHIVRPRGPLQWLDPGAFGTLAPVIIIYGDGSAGYSIMEFDSFVRMKLPVVAIAREQVPLFKSAISCDLAFNSYEKIGEALDTDGILLTNEDEAEIENTLKKAIDGSRTGRSAVINAQIGKTDFREGSLSV